MAQMVDRLQVPLLVGIGAAFDFHTGGIRDCAPWIKRAGLQWLHRLIQDPKHLWRRYLINNSAFLCRIAWSLVVHPRRETETRHVGASLTARSPLAGERFNAPR